MADESISVVNDFTRKFSINISHVPSGQTVSFGAFLNSFSDSFKTNFKSQPVYGRMDPIANFQNTTRTISLSFTVPASSLENSMVNLRKISTLVKFQYPSYTNAEVTYGIASPPICKVLFENLISENGNYLYGFFGGVDFSPINESGYFIDDSNRLYPKEFKVTLNFTVLHTQSNGWIGKNFNSKSFPYVVGSTAGEVKPTVAMLGNLDFKNIEPVDPLQEADGNELLT